MQLATGFNSAYREPRQPKIGQLARLLTYLQSRQSHGEEFDGITTLDAMRMTRPICRLSERIRELERLGYRFEKVREKTAGGARVIRYRLK